MGVAYDGNAGDDTVTNLPETQAEIEYADVLSEPIEIPVRDGYTFKGWYTDAECTVAYNFDSELTDNWTVLYAKWEKVTEDTTPAQTGDDFNMPLLAGIGMTALVLAASVTILRRRKADR